MGRGATWYPSPPAAWADHARDPGAPVPFGVRRFPVIVGPTAGGKSDLAVEVATRLARGEASGFGPGEILTADSMQVYRGLDIGAAKPTIDERRGVPHHLIDLRNPDEGFSVDEWLAAAERTIEEVRGRGGTPIVVGGTLMYVKAFLEGMFEGPPGDASTRAALREMAPAERRAELERSDPAAAARIHPNDERRTIRALEVARLTGRPISDWQGQWDSGRARADVLLVGLDWPTEAINRRINARVRSMMDRGLVAEVEGLWRSGRLGRQAREGLGYKQLVEVFEAAAREGRAWPDEPALACAVERIKVETRRFAKNQRTWLRRLRVAPVGAVLWLDAGERSMEDLAGAVVARLGGPEGGPEASASPGEPPDIRT